MQPTTYHRLAAQLYDLEDPLHRTRILDYYQHWVSETSAPSLEPMCGTGYFLIPFLQSGADVDGFDASEDMLNVCRAKCEQHRLRPTLLRQVLPEIDLPRRYGLIFIPDRSFGLLNDPAVACEALTELHAALLPGGQLVFDVAQPPDHWDDSGTWEGSALRLPDDTTVLTSMLVTHEEHGNLLRVFAKYEHFLDGHLSETELDEYAERFYPRRDMELLLSNAGFSHVRVEKAYDGGEPSEHERVVYICNE